MSILLENLRIKSGDTGLLKFAEENEKQLILFLNSQNVSFRTFFPLINFIRGKNLEKSLAYKYRVVINLCGDNDLEEFDYLCAVENIEIKSILMWIFQSANMNMKEKNYNEMIDQAICILICQYQESSILTDVCQLIFVRNRNDEYFHDIVWAFLRSFDKNIFKYIAYHLNSSNSKDTKLALSFLKPICESDPLPMNVKYWFEWVAENHQYLYYTNQNYQLSTDPCTFKIDHHSKFLGRPTIKHKVNSDIKSTEITQINQCFENADLKKASKYAHYMRSGTMRDRWNELTVEQKLSNAKSEVCDARNQ